MRSTSTCSATRGRSGTTGSRTRRGASARSRRSTPPRCPEDRAAAAEELDAWAEHGVGDWRAALGRFAEDRAPVYLRPDAEISAALRQLAARGDRLGVFTDAPEPLARIAVAQLGADRRIEALETGAGALERLLERLGPDALVVRERSDLPLEFAP